MQPKKIIFGLCSLLLSDVAAFAQYNRPYRITREASSFYISNQGNGSISRLDSTFNHRTVITGLYRPYDVLFGTYAGSKALIVVDSNQLKFYDPGNFNALGSVAIGGAVEAHDAVFNPNNANEMFISDRGGSQIIKASIGSAPFYSISFSTINQSIQRPAGMMFDREGRLLVLSDTTGGNVYQLNPTNGNDSLIVRTGLDFPNDLVQDAQGNFYLSNWGDDFVYRAPSGLDTFTFLSGFNTPSGLYANVEDDYLVVVCTECNKLEFLSLHMLIPEGDLISCSNDSSTVYVDQRYKGVGTYESANRFKVVLSDSKGDFTNGREIGSVNGTEVPDSIRVWIPFGLPSSPNYRYRLEASHPGVKGALDKRAAFIQAPEAFISDKTEDGGCQMTPRWLGKAASAHVTYRWTGIKGMNGNDSSAIRYAADSTGRRSISLLAVDTMSGCRSFSSLDYEVVKPLTYNDLGIITQEDWHYCPGEIATLGNDSLERVFRWYGNNYKDTLSEEAVYSFQVPLPYWKEGSWLSHQLESWDSSAFCTSRLNVFIYIDSVPDRYVFTGDYCACFRLCRDEKTLTLNKPEWDTLYGFGYKTTLPVIEEGNDYVILDVRNGVDGDPVYTLRMDKNTGCADTLKEEVYFGNPADTVIIVPSATQYGHRAVGVTDDYTLYWYVNGKTVYARLPLPMSMLKLGDSIQAIIGTKYCWDSSEIWIHGITHTDELVSDIIKLYPNPTNHLLQLQSDQPMHSVRCYDAQGRLQKEFPVYSSETQHSLDVSDLTPGIYLLSIELEDGSRARGRFVKE